MYGVGNLTRAAYANQRMTLVGNRQNFMNKAECDGRATWSNPRWRVLIIHVIYSGRLPMPPTDVSVWGHATSFCRAGVVVVKRLHGRNREAR